MNIIELRDNLSVLINAGYGDKIAGIAQINDLDYDRVGSYSEGN